jgi:5-amino-6-(5-phospho-D-ribitylamino)uracil phosphatase
MIKLVATDLDGTLLNSENMVSAANIRALQRVAVHGVRVALVTARKASSTSNIAAMLPLPCAQIMHNGARTWNWDGTELRHLRVPMALALEIARFADDHQIGLITTIDEVNYYGGRARSQWRNPDDIAVATNVEAVIAAPTRIIAAGTEGIERLCDMYGDAGDHLVLHRYYSRLGAIESAVLTHPSATKEHALAELCAAHGIGADEVIALGDAEADAGMLQWAGVGVAMGNGMPEALKAADWVAPSHDDSGFAAALDRFVK